MIKITSIALILFFISSQAVYAEKYLEVKPAFLENNVDVCSRLLHSISGGTSLPSVLPSNHLYADLISDHPRITAIDYNGTKLIVTLTPGITANMGLVYDHGNGMPPQIYKSNSSTLQQVDKINLTYEQYNESGFTMALVNAGNKDVTIYFPFASVLGIVLNYENGTSVNLYPYGISSSDNPFNSVQVLAWPSLGSTTLKPGQSVVQYTLSLPPDTHFNYYRYPPPGNYTLSSVARVIGVVDDKCTMVYVWSQPIVFTTLSEDQSTSKKIPEFPFAIPILLVSFVSLIVFYRMKFRK